MIATEPEHYKELDLDESLAIYDVDGNYLGDASAYNLYAFDNKTYQIQTGERNAVYSVQAGFENMSTQEQIGYKNF